MGSYAKTKGTYILKNNQSITPIPGKNMHMTTSSRLQLHHGRLGHGIRDSLNPSTTDH